MFYSLNATQEITAHAWHPITVVGFQDNTCTCCIYGAIGPREASSSSRPSWYYFWSSPMTVANISQTTYHFLFALHNLCISCAVSETWLNIGQNRQFYRAQLYLATTILPVGLSVRHTPVLRQNEWTQDDAAFTSNWVTSLLWCFATWGSSKYSQGTTRNIDGETAWCLGLGIWELRTHWSLAHLLLEGCHTATHLTRREQHNRQCMALLKNNLFSDWLISMKFNLLVT